MIKQENLPDTWEVKELQEVLYKLHGGVNSEQNEEEGDYPVSRIETISDGYVDPKSVQYTTISNEKFDRYKAENGDILFSNINSPEHIGKTAIYTGEPENMVHGMNLIWMRPNKEIVHPKFLHYQLQALRNKGLFKNMCKTAINQASLAQRDIKPINIALPPLGVQEELVSVLDEGFERAERVSEYADQLEQLANEYKETEYNNYFDLDFIPEHWDVKKLDEISKRTKSTCETEDGTEYDLYSFEAVDSGQKFFVTDGEEINSRKRELSGGEILLSRLNPRISRVCKVEEKSENKQIASTEFVAINLTSKEVSKEFLYNYLKTPVIKKYLKNQTTGSTGSHSRVSFDTVMNLDIPIPTLEEQESIFRHLEDVEKTIDSIEKKASDVERFKEEYKNSLLNSAFTGKLVN